MRDFFCYKNGKKRKGNGVEVRRNIPSFTCDFVANERDTTVIILLQIVRVGLKVGGGSYERSCGALNEEAGKSINRNTIKSDRKDWILRKLVSALINTFFSSLLFFSR
jgi:hypothetical protein